jgi:hypothetical protein
MSAGMVQRRTKTNLRRSAGDDITLLEKTKISPVSRETDDLFPSLYLAELPALSCDTWIYHLLVWLLPRHVHMMDGKGKR